MNQLHIGPNKGSFKRTEAQIFQICPSNTAKKEEPSVIILFQKCIIRFNIEIQGGEPCKGNSLLRKAEHDNIQSELVTCGRTLTTIRAIKTSRHPFIAFFKFQNCSKQIKCKESLSI